MFEFSQSKSHNFGPKNLKKGIFAEKFVKIMTSSSQLQSSAQEHSVVWVLLLAGNSVKLFFQHANL